MKFTKKQQRERAELPGGDETTAAQPDEQATTEAPERADYVPRRYRVNVRGFSRAAPRSQELRVIRPWPGVTRGQIIHVNPAAERRLVLGGFVEVV